METENLAQYETNVLLEDGSTVLLRSIHSDDAEACVSFIHSINSQSKFLRLGHPKEAPTIESLRNFCKVDYASAFVVAAEVVHDGKEMVAIARYYKLPGKNSAELFMLVDEKYQEKGLGLILLEDLGRVARGQGISTFETDVPLDREPIHALISSFGFHVTKISEKNVSHVILPIVATKKSIHKEEEEQRLATISSLKSILYPKSIAVIGASRNPGTIGYNLVRALIQSGYVGAVYPVNPNIEVVSSIKTYPSVMAIPGDVEMAIIAVAASVVLKVAEECGQKGVKGLIVISDGFKEAGQEGAARERELREIALGHGMRIVGPNCMGVLNTDPAISMNATFSPANNLPGNVSFLSQSGAMGEVILDYARSLNIGLSTFVSAGNRADVSPNDLVQYWEHDAATKVILLYLESFGNPHNFMRITRRVSAKKPIVVVKSGSTSAGSRAASSHTGALATSETVTQALFRQAGILRVDGVEELFDVASLLSNQPLPKGRRLVIVTNGGGPGILAADAASNHGLLLPEISPETLAAIKTHLKRNIHIGNPIDTTAQASPAEFEGILQELASDKGSDAVLFIFVPPSMVDVKEVENGLRRVAPLFRSNKKTLLICFMGHKGFSAEVGSPGKYVPSYLFPESAISALTKAVEYSERLARSETVPPKMHDINRDKAKQIINGVMKQSTQPHTWLSMPQIGDLLGCYGIRFAETKLAKTAQETAAIAAKIGFPVVIKLESTTITHKTDVGGVKLNIKNEAEAKQAFDDIKAKLTELGKVDQMDGVMIQKMVTEGIEAIVGVSNDPSFGHLIMFGLGGVNAELMNDVVFRLNPLTELDAQELISSIKMSKLFDGYRGTPASDKPALNDLLLRLSALVEDNPQITELDFNPVKVLAAGLGYWVVDARIAVS
jgi:acetyltransferase